MKLRMIAGGALCLISAAAAAAQPSVSYVGSMRCKDCHAEIYGRWKKTLMANVIRDPKTDPEAILPDLSSGNPLVTFRKEDITWVYGSKWKQRYFQKIGDDFFPLPAQWDVANRVWRPYHVPDGADWWTAVYPPQNTARPTGPLCDGCHSVGYDIRTKAVAEWNVGCEKCHGPGSAHIQHPGRATIVNPARLDPLRASDICIQCHSQGRPPGNPIEGKFYDWPVGYRAGLNLTDYWQLEEHKAGETTFTHFADGTAHKNRMQGNDFVASAMYVHGVTCFSCHDVHGTANNADLLKPPNVLCLECHGPKSPNGPRAAMIEQHTHHREGSSGSECVACHMPRIEQTIANVNVRSHTFRFIPPAETESLKVPNACNGCHADKPVKWAADTLKGWREFSPWRVAN